MAIPNFYNQISYPNIVSKTPLDTMWATVTPYEKFQTEQLERESTRQLMGLREKEDTRAETRLGMEGERLGLEKERAGRETSKFDKEQARDEEYKAAAGAGGSRAQMLGRMMEVSLRHGNVNEYNTLANGLGNLAQEAETNEDYQTAQEIQSILQGVAANPNLVKVMQERGALKKQLAEVPLRNVEIARDQLAESKRQHDMTFRASENRANQQEAKENQRERKALVVGAGQGLAGVSKLWIESQKAENDARAYDRKAQLAEAATQEKGREDAAFMTALAQAGLPGDTTLPGVQSVPVSQRAPIYRAEAERLRQEARSLGDLSHEEMQNVRNTIGDEGALEEAASRFNEKQLPRAWVGRRAPGTASAPTIYRGAQAPAPVYSGGTPGMPGYVQPGQVQAQPPAAPMPVARPSVDPTAAGVAATMAGSGVPMTGQLQQPVAPAPENFFRARGLTRGAAQPVPPTPTAPVAPSRLDQVGLPGGVIREVQKAVAEMPGAQRQFNTADLMEAVARTNRELQYTPGQNVTEVSRGVVAQMLRERAAAVFSDTAKRAVGGVVSLPVSGLRMIKEELPDSEGVSRAIHQKLTGRR